VSSKITAGGEGVGVTRVLVVTNDFPPRPGGIQTFVHELVRRLPPQHVLVYTSQFRGWQAFDAAQPFRVVREHTSVLLPTPLVSRRAVALAEEHGADAVLFGAAAPLGLLAPALRAAGVRRTVGITHGHEAGWAGYPGARAVLRRVGDAVDVLTYLGEYTRGRIGAAVGPATAGRMVRLTPGVDPSVFRPGRDGSAVRARHGLDERPVVVCVSRLMPRKGQDVLIRALPRIRLAVPEAALLLVGGGPDRGRLQRLAADTGMAAHVVLTGSVPFSELPEHYAAGDVFAMPCRTRHLGLDVEGLGIVYLEASATGLPVVAGRSGGAPDAVLPGQTGEVVDGTDVPAVAAAVASILADPSRARAMGEAGRRWVGEQWTWDRSVARLAELLAPGG
jgi:phosphatidylinositol alpha-1,6-mannosyltransferase